MLFSILAGGNMREIIISILLTIPVVLISLSVHESAHGYIAMKLGDPTAYNLGRVTINPLKHIDPLGALCMLALGYGWAKPVPINARNFKNPKVGMALTAIAGPVSNIILGVIGAVAAPITFIVGEIVAGYITASGLVSSTITLNVLNTIITFCELFSLMNFMLAAFNLIPVPPFDGSRFVSLFLPTKIYFAIMKYEKFVMIGVLVGIIVLSRVFNFSPFYEIAKIAFSAVATPTYYLANQLFLLILSFVA